MSFLFKILTFCLMIIQVNASYIDEHMRQKLAVIDKLRKADIDPKYKVGLDELEKLVRDILPSILPDLPTDDLKYAETFQNNYKTVKLPIIKTYLNNDFLVFRMGISKYYRDKPEKSKAILDKMTELFKEYNQDSYTCMDYLEFIGKLVSISENTILGSNSSGKLELSMQIFKASIEHDDLYVLPFPMHTKHIEFDGIYGEATITAGMIIGMWPIMYVSRPDAVADETVHGPIQTTWHDLGAHYLLFINNPIWFLKMPDFIINHHKIDDDLIKYLFDQFHEVNNLNFLTLELNRPELFPLYLDMINYVINAVSQHVTKYTDIKPINLDKLNSVILSLKHQGSENPSLSKILTYCIQGEAKDLNSDSRLSTEDNIFINTLLVGKSVNDGLKSVESYKKMLTHLN